jgi:hypothetical protein
MCSRKNMRMQADIRLNQPGFPGMCPLCNSSLNSAGPATSPNSIFMCPACGFSGPFVQRQRHLSSQADQRPSQNSPSVWIDPAVSAFLFEGQSGQVDYTQSILQPRSKHRPKKPHSISSSPGKGPITPIPPRASAQRSNYVSKGKVRPKYVGTYAQLEQQESDISRIPTYPQPAVWQYESPDFEIESSLPALSLIVDASIYSESAQSPRRTGRLPNLDELDTLPAQKVNQVTIDEIDTSPLRLKSQQLDIDEIDTLPPLVGNEQNARSLVPLNQPATMALAPTFPNLPSPQGGSFDQKRLALAQQISDPSSWTAGSASGSRYARRIAERPKSTRRKHFLNPIDNLRWWLLHPGRIEFILWLGGTILLLSVTILLSLATAISLSRFAPLTQNGSIPTLNNSGNSPSSSTTVVTNGKMTLSLLNTGPLVAGQPLYLRGQGFSPNGTIVFTDEKKHPMLKQNSQTSSVQADGYGSFSVTLNDNFRTTGQHSVIVLDVTTGNTLSISITFSPGPFGKNVTPTSPALPPGLTATATSTNGPGAFPTAAGSTPVAKPTVATTPPAPSPTRQPSPTPTATPVITPTTVPGTTPTVGTTPTAGSSSLHGSNNFIPSGAAASIGESAYLPHSSTNLLASWTWLLMLGYIFAMFMLGIAGILRKRHHKS